MHKLFAGCRDKDWSKDFDLADEKVVWDESKFVDDEHTTIGGGHEYI